MKCTWIRKWKVKVKSKISWDEIGNWQFSANCQQRSVKKVSVVDLTACISNEPFQEGNCMAQCLAKSARCKCLRHRNSPRVKEAKYSCSSPCMLSACITGWLCLSRRNTYSTKIGVIFYGAPMLTKFRSKINCSHFQFFFSFFNFSFLIFSFLFYFLKRTC